MLAAGINTPARKAAFLATVRAESGFRFDAVEAGNDSEFRGSLNLGPEMQRGQPAREMLAERRRLDAALAELEPQRPGTIDIILDEPAAQKLRSVGNQLASSARV